MKKICVTGANGFIGKSLCKALSSSGRSIRGFVRTLDSNQNSTEIEHVSVGETSSEINWIDQLHGFDCIVHCAGKAHNINEKKNLDSYRLINTENTKLIAEQAAKAGLKRFIFLSSVKVNGESTDKIDNNKTFINNDVADPKDAYSISKFEAEKVLWEISLRTGLEVVVVRLPLVYGYGAKGNLNRLIKLINSGIPLPFGLIKNKRSLIGIDNLIDVLTRCIDHPNAKSKTFLVSDDEDLSTPDLIKLIASSMKRSPRLFPVPVFLLKLLGYILGKQKEINRLAGSLKIDSSYTKETLNWTPPVTAEEGIRRMVQGK